MSNKPTFIPHIRSLIAKDDLKTAIQQLSALLKDSPQLDEALQLSARYHHVLKQIRLGVVEVEAANVTHNQIRHGLLALFPNNTLPFSSSGIILSGRKGR